MEDIHLLINCGGHWKGIVYEYGYPELAFIHRNLTYEELLSRVHEIILVDPNSYVYEMKALLNT